jgi:hypothetical protein
MRHAQRFTTALVLAGMVGSGMMLGSARLEAKGKGNGGGGGTICDALAAIINYKYTSPTIRDYAMSLFTGYQCDASLIN